MPAIGLGAFEAASGADAAVQAVEAALACGYRLIDTAAAYGDERQVGAGIAKSGVPRDELFVVTKLWIADYGRAERAYGVSLRKLGLDYVDLYLLHWPVPSDFEATVAAYRVLEDLLEKRRVRAIGVSNFNADHLENLIARTGVVPAVNQIELHPYFNQSAVRAANARRGIVTQSWSPLGGVRTYMPQTAGSDLPAPVAHPTVQAIAGTHGKTPGQVILRWHVQHGCSAVPKTVHPGRMAENLDVFDFMLAPGEMAAIDGLDTGIRSGPDPDHWDTSTIALTIED